MRIGWKDPLVSARIDRLFAAFTMAWLLRSSCPCIRGFHVSNVPDRQFFRVSNVESSCLLFGPRFFKTRSTTTSVTVAATAENSITNAIINGNWKGASASYSSSSEYVTHVLVDSDMIKSKASSPFTVLDAIQSVLDQQQPKTATPITPAPPLLTARELIAMGSVWFLPRSAPRDPAKGEKPKRLYSPQNETRVLHVGDYLRVHHFPRRFLQVHDYDWSRRINDDDDSDDDDANDSNDRKKKKPGVIVAENEEKGWLVIDKPNGVPVHMTVDNCRENVQDCLYRARKAKRHHGSADHIYVSTPHRLDQNTSGLFVVATSKLFASYYAQLLRFKTALQLKDQQDDSNNNNNNADATTTEKAMIIGSVHKVYRCLVCIIEPPGLSLDDDSGDSSGWSVNSVVNDLMSFATNNKTMRHFLEPSIRAPKRFLSEQPHTAAAAGEDDNDDENDKNAWLECLLKIRSVGQVCALVGNRVGEDLGRKLWSEHEMQEDGTSPLLQQPNRIPANCRAVVELEVELLTGRTHQIRGQLAASGFPLVGDTQYGGAIPIGATTAPGSTQFQPERLALQCCELSFVDPDIYKQDDKEGTLIMKRSKRWNKFRLSSAWWTPLMKEYDEQVKQWSASEVTTNMFDALEKTSTTATLAQADSNDQPAKTHLLPERIQLSPGKHKYVLIRANHPNDDIVHWFVKSAAPEECGGPYHGNVAQDLCEWIKAAGYSPQVTGGGRIDYDPLAKRCIVYGFSYGFGKGDHAFASNLIRRIAGIPATHDDRDGLY